MSIKLFLVVQITCTDLSSLLQRFHSLKDAAIKIIAYCWFFVAISMLRSELMTTTSSANVASIVFAAIGNDISAVNNKYYIEPTTLPCGTPADMSFRFDVSSLYLTKNFL